MACGDARSSLIESQHPASVKEGHHPKDKSVSAVIRVSCLLAVWNGEAYVADAIRSVLDQTFGDFELITIDDGSTDGTATILRRFQREDARVRVFTQPHTGLISALNRGVSLATGEYIARMDADDLCMPQRFSSQVQYMDRHRAVGICGTWVETFGSGRAEVVRYPCDDATIRSRLLFDSSLAHPSVIMRRQTLESHGLSYDTLALHAEDYDLWVRAAPHTRFANIPEALLRYRIHPEQVGQRHGGKQEASTRRIRLTQLHGMGIKPSEYETDLHQSLCQWEFSSAPEYLRTTRAWLCQLMAVNSKARNYPMKEFRMVLSRRWADVCVAATTGGIRTLMEFWRAPRLARSGLSPMSHLKFAVKCLVRQDPSKPFMIINNAMPR